MDSLSSIATQIVTRTSSTSSPIPFDPSLLDHQTLNLMKCSTCGTEQLRMNTLDDGSHQCRDCEEKERQAHQATEFLAGIGPWVDRWCLAAGMGPREITARVELIKAPIKRSLPIDIVKEMLAGHPFKSGFGIGGTGTGAGKTCALAAIFRQGAMACATELAAKMPTRPSPNLVWESWPSTVAWIRMNAISDDFPARVDRMIQAPVLFLDDLGSERIKGSYVEDFAASQLDLIVDSRYRDMLPTFYTTNLDLKGLTEFYGARLVSRLCGENPLCIVEGLPDQRMAQ